MTAIATAEAKIMEARITLRKALPFVGDLLIYLQPEFTDKVPTMAVNRKNELLVNREWTDNLEQNQVQAVIIHEILHLALFHLYRLPQELDTAVRNNISTPELEFKHKVYNWACDLKINFMFHEMNRFEHLPKTDFKPDRYGKWSITTEDGLCLKLTGIDEKSAERLYVELLNQLPPQSNLPSLLMVGSHDPWFDPNELEGLGAGDLDAAAGDWMIRVANSLNSEQSKGSMPASLLRELQGIMEPRIDWRNKLQRFVQPIVAAGFSYRRPRRTSWVLGTILPGQDREGVSIIVHFDTSGSMGTAQLEAGAAELYGMLDAYSHTEIKLLHSDAGYPGVIDLRSTDKDDLKNMVKFKGGGGTSHQPVIKWVQDERPPDAQALILFTDGYSDLERCMPTLGGSLSTMLICTNESKLKDLEQYFHDSVHLPI